MNPLQTGMFPQSQMDKTQFAVPTQMPVSREIISSDFDSQIDPYTGNLPRFKEGGDVGIKSIAKDLAQYGRYNDDMVAHISSDEARMLKAMGGAGTINPTTGLPEYGLGKLNPVKAISKVGDALGISQAATKVFQPIEKAVVQPVSQGLASFDKAIGETIPGGWGTLGMAAASFVPGMTPMMMGGLGALTGSGVLRPGGKFNLQGALMGGAVAYGMSSLAQGLEAAGGAPSPTAPTVPVPDASSIASSIPSATTSFGDFAGSLSDPTAGMASAYVPSPAYVPPPPPGITSNLMSGNFNQAASQIGDKFTSAGQSMANFADKATTGSTYADLAKGYGENVANAGRGIANLTGMGDTTSAAAQKAFEASGAKLTNTVLPIAIGTMGLSDLEAQRNYEQDAQAQNNAANAEWNAIMAGVEANRRRGEEAVRANPYQYAEGGSIPRFLSGGGDGLSDDIPATIEGKQPARLADGEFVVSADVVSGLGGGSSKAGARKLYDMMDRVRKQAHGTTRQVRKVSNKALPA